MAHYAVEYGITRHPLAFLFCSFSLFFPDIKCGSTAAGKLVENVLQNIINTINACVPNYKIVSKVGSTDYLSKSINYKGSLHSMNTIQVDRHVFSNGKRIAFIENKTYLDSCYYD